MRKQRTVSNSNSNGTIGPVSAAAAKHVRVTSSSSAAKAELLPLLRYADCDACGGSDESESFLLCTRCRCRIHPQCLAVAPSDDYTYEDEWTCSKCVAKLASISVTPAQLFSPERMANKMQIQLQMQLQQQLNVPVVAPLAPVEPPKEKEEKEENEENEEQEEQEEKMDSRGAEEAETHVAPPAPVVTETHIMDVDVDVGVDVDIDVGVDVGVDVDVEEDTDVVELCGKAQPMPSITPAPAPAPALAPASTTTISQQVHQIKTGEAPVVMTSTERFERGLVAASASASTSTSVVTSSATLQTRPDQFTKVLRVRHTPQNVIDFLVETVSGSHEWVGKNHLASRPDLLVGYFMSPDFDRMVMSRNVLPLLYADSCQQGDMTVITYRFASNNAYFGVKQYINVFDQAFLKFLENQIDETVRLGSAGGFKPHSYNCTPALKRSKFFFGFAYVDYQYGSKPELVDDVEDIPAWIHQLEDRLVDKGVMPKDFLEQAVVNMYHEQGSGLGVHTDSWELFERPIYSLRLFSDSVLSFGCKGLGMVLRKQAVPLYRGAVTIMENYAANKTKHCIRPADIHCKSSSLLLRKIRPRAKQLLQNKKQLVAAAATAVTSSQSPATTTTTTTVEHATATQAAR